jgi:hypothetical protein
MFHNRDYEGALNAGANAVFLGRDKIPYEDTPENISVCKAKSVNYTTIYSLHELYPLMCQKFKPSTLKTYPFLASHLPSSITTYI